jgi:hypothetical protein
VLVDVPLLAMVYELRVQTSCDRRTIGGFADQLDRQPMVAKPRVLVERVVVAYCPNAVATMQRP